MKKRVSIVHMVLLFVGLTAVFCQATEMRENQKLLCAITEVIECSTLGDCSGLSAEDAGLPDFLMIDLEEKKIMEATTVSLRETRFNTSSEVEGVTILSGIDGLRGWSAVLSEDNSRLSATISDESAGFVVFGACRVEL